MQCTVTLRERRIWRIMCLFLRWWYRWNGHHWLVSLSLTITLICTTSANTDSCCILKYYPFSTNTFIVLMSVPFIWFYQLRKQLKKCKCLSACPPVSQSSLLFEITNQPNKHLVIWVMMVLHWATLHKKLSQPLIFNPIFTEVLGGGGGPDHFSRKSEVMVKFTFDGFP